MDKIHKNGQNSQKWTKFIKNGQIHRNDRIAKNGQN